jgi:hypothetical protein
MNIDTQSTRTARPVELTFSVESLRKALGWMLGDEQAPHNQFEVVQWCERFASHGRERDDSEELEAAARVAADVDCQFECWLDSKFDEEERASLDLNQIKMPREWVLRWVSELEPPNQQ